MLKKMALLSFVLFIVVMNSVVYPVVHSQWRGPNRDGIYSDEKNLLKKWTETGPTVLWSVNGLGEGFSSPAVTSDKIYVTGMLDKMGYLFAFDKNGKLLWKKSYGAEWEKSFPGCRTTPLIVDDRVYLMSGYGRVVCMNAQTGDEVWAVDTAKDFSAQLLQWGITESLLVEGDRLICTPGGPQATVVALDRKTGKTIWICKGNGENSGYCSPILVQQGKTKLIITMTQKSIIGVNFDNGTLLWTFPHVTDWDINPNTPIVKNGNVFCLSGYGSGSVMLKMNADGTSVQKAWENKEFDSQIGSAVLIDGYLYGSGHNSKGWKCVDWQTGQQKYVSNELGKGNIIAADGMMYCYSEKGELGLVQPNPNQFTVISTAKVSLGNNQHWAHLVIRDGRLYVRHGDTLIVYSVGNQK
jgi:outer membrane protein assembly factor BamB